jgi:hypothetical protein
LQLAQQQLTSGFSFCDTSQVSFSRRVSLENDRDRLLRLDELLAWQWLKRCRRNRKRRELLAIEKGEVERSAGYRGQLYSD